MAATFQSTRPMRGATRPPRLLTCRPSNFNPRAPCGARPAPPRRGRRPGNFNPRAPCGARLAKKANGLDPIVFQSTRPMRGATQHCGALHVRRNISIHAPHAGRDGFFGLKAQGGLYFNPRAPCGARHDIVKELTSGFKFQSTRPMRGATAKVYKITLHTFATKGNS